MKILKSIVKTTILVTIVVCCVLYRPMSPKRQLVDDAEANYYANLLYSQHNHYLLPTTKQKYKEKINKELVVQRYKEKSVDLDWMKASGFSATIFNLIVIDDDLSPVDYCVTLTHEILHYKYFSVDERYIEFQTFVTLYESNDIELKNVGVKYGYSKLTETNVDAYWCKDLIIDYLKGVLI